MPDNVKISAPCKSDFFAAFGGSWQKHCNLVGVTFFKSHSAKTLTFDWMHLSELRDLILGTTANTKAKLPWLKFARFGDKKTDDGGSLRHDENVEGLWGIESDYDGEEVAIPAAVQLLKDANIYGMIYASPSHTPEKPRWRAVCPTSQELPPSDRYDLVARLNGVLGGIIGNESFTLSQSYYYGHVKGTPERECIIVEGDFIDLRDDLDEGAIGKKNGNASSDKKNNFEIISEMREAKPTTELKNAVADLLIKHFPAKGRHYGMMAVGGCLARAGWVDEDIEETARIIADKGGSDAIKTRTADAMDAAKAFRDGDKSYGFPKFKEIFGEEAAEAFHKIVPSIGTNMPEGRSTDDFYAFLPTHKFMNVHTRTLWPAVTIDSIIRPIQIGVDDKGNPKSVKASIWLDNHRKVDDMTWAPGEPMIVTDRLINNGGWFDHPGAAVFNTYLPPKLNPPPTVNADPYLELVHKVFPPEADHLLDCFAHVVQNPADKINHAIIFGGVPGIGKDTLLEALRYSVGPWNFADVSPRQVLGRFNGFFKSRVVRVSEARDLGNDRYAFYEHMKAYTTSPPETIFVDEKHTPEFYIPNCCAVVYTTNNKDSFYLPPDDRRHYVAWSDRVIDDFSPDYWIGFYRWLRDGGCEHVAAYLMARNISGFDHKAPPPKTPVFWEMVGLNTSPEDDELADALDSILPHDAQGNPVRPDAVTTAMIGGAVINNGAPGNFYDWLNDRKNNRAIPHRMGKCGYVSVRNESSKDGRWVIGGKRHVIFVKAELTIRDRHVAAQGLVSRNGEAG